jgi:hypothetical protein
MSRTLTYTCTNTECDDEGISWPVALQFDGIDTYFANDEAIFCGTCTEEGRCTEED